MNAELLSRQWIGLIICKSKIEKKFQLLDYCKNEYIIYNMNKIVIANSGHGKQGKSTSIKNKKMRLNEAKQEKMTIYPVIIPTLCRYELFRKCVDSLLKCNLSEQTELVIGLDFPLNKSHEEGWKKIKTYIDTITGFRKLTVLTSDVNLGASKNSERLKEYVYASYDAVIFTEDDNFFSPCFLEFMNKALNKFRDHPKITSVCGYTPMPYYGVTDNSLILTHDAYAWGYGLWSGKGELMKNEYYYKICTSFRNAYRIFMEYPGEFCMLSEMVKRKHRYGDIMRTADNIINDTYQLKPSLSMVRNLGQDGSGLHSGVNPEYLMQPISKENHFEFTPDAISLAFKQIRKCRKSTFKLALSPNKLKALFQIPWWGARSLYNFIVLSCRTNK